MNDMPDNGLFTFILKRKTWMHKFCRNV